MLVPVAYATYAFDIASAGAFEFSLVLFAFHACLLRAWGGSSLGKHVMNIAVVSANGLALTLTQCAVRAACIALPWTLVGLSNHPLFRPNDGAYPVVPLATMGVLLLLVDVLLIEYTPSRQSLTDRIARTWVVKLPPPEAHRAPALPMYSASDAEFGPAPQRPPQRPRDSRRGEWTADRHR